MVNVCAVPSCKNPASIGFPQNPAVQKKWCIAIGRSDPSGKTSWKPAYHHKICRNHFKPSDFLPTIVYQLGASTNTKRFRLNPNAIPSIFNFSDQTNQNGSTGTSESGSSSLSSHIIVTPETFESVENLDNALENPTDPLLHPRTDSDTISEAEPKAMELDIKIEPELEIKIEPDLWPDETQIQPEPIRIQQSTNRRQKFDIEELRSRSDVVHYYTGFDNYNQLCDFFYHLGTDLNHITDPLDELSGLDEFLLTVIKLRQNKDFFELGFLFGIDESVAKAIFHSWLRFLFKQLQKADSWPGENIVIPTFIPRQTSSCTINEEPIKSHPSKRAVKVMLGINSKGLTSSASDVHNNSISDLQLTQMTHSRCSSKDVARSSESKPTNMESSKMENSKVENVIEDRRARLLRCHVNNVVSLTKKFKILSQGLKLFKAKTRNQVIFVCFGLCNFISFKK